MSTVEIKTLFDESRYPSGWSVVTLLLYSPLGLILAVIRLFIALQAVCAAALLPQLSIVRRFVLRSICFVLGIIVREENVSVRDETVRLLVSNHVTRCDHIAVHLVTNCVTPCAWEQPAPIFRVMGIKDLGLPQGQDAVIAGVRNHLEKCSTPVLAMPEGATTNGTVGLLKFSTWPFRASSSVQPVVLRVWRPSLLCVAPTALATTSWADVFWFLFSPFTVFTLKYLPAMQSNGEDGVQFSERVQKAIAEALGVLPTKYTAGDKAEYEKRFLLEQNRPTAVVGPQYSSNNELQRMARQVGEVLPLVPYDVIVRDLARTRSVDVTISNILEGQISYRPLAEPRPPPPTINHAVSSSIITVSSSTTVSTSATSAASPAVTTSSQGQCLDTSAPSFPRSAQERMMSFHERKARLVENARKRYIEKHGLKIVGFNC
ncbi:lipid droplet-regulating VLDL assembly factor AUP1 [Anabrus simplex]|uniref:lipid droplet-regulating VLDL assembly factor AUP1 n=1 Tax=Anabrus simplex TaxID=316456 RepID=UPI0034DD2AF9